ncbi:hypothetical protein [Oceanobacter mangrovi]|uniref:hypothetical protein n=1 Tax=Oceanobacter mangrovi TaxID=2862510 RepID=UPI001C8DED82|nr:hypothetical protein [Oceanobacter mangrovi]
MRSIIPLASICLAGLLPVAQAEEAATEDTATKADSYTYAGGFLIGYKYQEMEADTIRNAYVRTIGLNIFEFEWEPGKASWLDPVRRVADLLPALRYEMTPGNTANQDQIAEVSNTAEEKAGWTRFLANIDVDPVSLLGGDDSMHRIIGSYEIQTFLVSVQATQDYYYIQNNDAQLLVAGDGINVNTIFKEATLGYRVTDPGSYAMDLGWFNVNYEKPISSDVSMPLESIYRAEFEASGLFFGASLSLGSWTFGGRYDLGYDAKATVDGGVSLSRTEYGFDESIEYSAYRIDVQYDLKKSSLRWPLAINLNYLERSFSTLADGDNINDDRILGISLQSRFEL